MAKTQKDIQSEIWKNHTRAVHDKYLLEYPNTRGEKLIDFLSDKDVETVLEIGCSSGRNLKYLSEHSDLKLNGIDINKIAIQEAKKNVPSASVRVCNIHNLRSKKKYDVVYTGGVIMHMPPDDVVEVLQRCISISNKYVIHMEPVGDGSVIKGPAELNPIHKVRKMMKCEHDIVGIYKSLGFSTVATYTRGDPEPFIVVEVG